MPVNSLAARIKMLVLDVDGVLTDAGVYYGPSGCEFKRFNTQDGLGLKLLLRAGIQVGVITAAKSKAVAARMKDLGIIDYAEGIDKKLPVLDSMRTKYNLAWDEIAYVGDDWVDLGPLKKVGLPVAVANAQPEVKDCASYITEARGGDGAVREVAKLILTAQDKYLKVLEHEDTQF